MLRERGDQRTHLRILRDDARVHTGLLQRRGANWPHGGHDDVVVQRANQIVE
jgi:hypothetical protein